MQDIADWTGIEFASNGVGGGHRYRGNVYANEHEVLLAKLLRRRGIPYTPHVRIPVRYPDDRIRPYHPDFVFNGLPYVWTPPRGGRVVLIHGFEAKAHASGPVGPQKIQLLREQRGIHVLVIDNDLIAKLFNERYLPLEPFAH